MRQLSKSQNKRYKKEQKESYLHKLTTKYNKPTYVFAQKETKGILLFILAIGLFFVPAYGYYNNVYLPSLPHPHHVDPFTTLWNGQIPNTFTTRIGSSSTMATIGLGTSKLNTFIGTNGPVNFGECVTTTSTGIPSRLITQLANFTTTRPQNLAVVIYSATGTPGTSCIPSTVSAGVLDESQVIIGPSNNITLQPTTFLFTSTQPTTGNSNVQISSGIYVFVSITTTNNPGDTGDVAVTNGVTDANQVIESCTVNTSTLVNSGCATFNFCTALSGANSCMGYTLFSSLSTITCEQVGYHCFNSNIASGNIQINPNLNQTIGVAESSSFIDLSTGVNKSITFGEFSLNTPAFAGDEIGWFLTTNATMITSNVTTNQALASYSPLNDTSVSLFVLEVWTSSTSVNYYVYMQRASGQISRIPTQGDNPYPTGKCPQSSTIFLCASSTHGANVDSLALALNFTGNSNGSGSGESYLCIDHGLGSTTCNLGGNNNQQVQVTNTNFVINFTSPWINPDEKYYVGYWAKQNVAESLAFTTSNVFLQDNMISLYSPSGSTKTTGFDFFGFLGSAIGTWWGVKVASTCSTPIIQNICQAPQNIESSFVAAALVLINGLALGVRIFFNGIGNALSLGNLGDELIQFFSGIASWLTSISGVAFGQLANIATQGASIINSVVLFLTFTNLSNLVIQFLSNIGLTVPLLNTLFNDAITLFSSFNQFATFMFFVWYLWLGVAIYFRGYHGAVREFKNLEEFLTHLFHGGYFFAKESWEIALHIKQMITGWL